RISAAAECCWLTFLDSGRIFRQNETNLYPSLTEKPSDDPDRGPATSIMEQGPPLSHLAPTLWPASPSPHRVPRFLRCRGPTSGSSTNKFAERDGHLKLWISPQA